MLSSRGSGGDRPTPTGSMAPGRPSKGIGSMAPFTSLIPMPSRFPSRPALTVLDPWTLHRARPRTPWANTILYETHVRGLTVHPSANVANPGTFDGIIEKIPYFQDLGITALELMPVQAFQQVAVAGRDPSRPRTTGATTRSAYSPSTAATRCRGGRAAK